jgi:hypothetical protein
MSESATGERRVIKLLYHAENIPSDEQAECPASAPAIRLRVTQSSLGAVRIFGSTEVRQLIMVLRTRQ